MLYIAVDTCVWLDLIKVDPATEVNIFEELLFWIENKHLTCIISKNLIDEWDRNKSGKKQYVINIINDHKDAAMAFTGPTPMDTIYTEEKVEKVISARIDRVDRLFQTLAERAPETPEIYLKAAQNNLACIAPNHKKDSFRDTVNYMTIAEYVKGRGYSKCYFTTINKTDFSDPGNEFNLHPILKSEFEAANLEYHFFESKKKSSVGGKLFNQILKNELPSFRRYLEDLKKSKERKAKQELESEKIAKLSETDRDYLINSGRIDDILGKESRDEIDELILEFLFKKHPAYQKYFFKKLAENGLV